jgi:hypothetical protein
MTETTKKCFEFVCSWVIDGVNVICYGSTRTVFVDFVSRLLLQTVTCLLTFFMTATNKIAELGCTS